jgi:hypothetical protein
VAKIFISYNANDHIWAEWIGVTLRDNGHEPFVSGWEISAGQNIPHWMNEKVELADNLLGVFSDAYVGAIYSGAERDAAFWNDPSGCDGFLIPVEVERVSKWPPFVKPLKRLSLVGLNEKEAEGALLTFLKQPSPPKKRPPFPGKAPGKIGRKFEGTSGLDVDSFVYRTEPLPAIRPAFPISSDIPTAGTHFVESRSDTTIKGSDD